MKESNSLNVAFILRKPLYVLMTGFSLVLLELLFV